MTRNDVIEGNFLRVRNGDIFEVRGLVHPRTWYVAYPRYVRTDYGERINGNEVSYRKLSTLQEKTDYLQKIMPSYVQFDWTRDRTIPLVPKKDVNAILEPVARLKEIMEYRNSTCYNQTIIDFVNQLTEHTSIALHNLGVIGSHLAGLVTAVSDIDVIVYGYDVGQRLYKEMNHVFSESKQFKKYSNDELKRFAQMRWGKSRANREILDIERRKLLQGRFRSKDFFIRLVPIPSDSESNYEDYLVRSSGYSEISCEIVESKDGIFSPCEYSVICKNDPLLTKIVGYRSRFSEHARKGMKMKSFGRVESVISKRGGFHKQLVLGSSSSDFLVPIE